MLWLERLDVVGFKSFSDRAQIEFPQGITAVVGPNGCGKSNIADAIQWVLGEQSARALRGQRMEDVIFAGSESRGAGGMAEVSLHLKVRGEPLPDGREQVVLTRRLFRTGQSDYLIDGKKARLTDVRALLDHVRAGVRTYAIIDQGHVASFVESKPRERRIFIEEAAGIAGYKARRRAAELKLEATRGNLLRVEDILREVERQQRSLKRQASLARRARRLDEQLRALRSVWYRRRDRELSALVDQLGEELAVAQTEATHLGTERERLSQALAAARAELERAHRERDDAVETTHSARLEEERQRRAIESALVQAETLEREAGRHEGEGEVLGEERERREREIARLQEEERSLSGSLGELDERVAAAQREADGRRAEQRALVDEASARERALYEQVHARAELTARRTAAEESVRRGEHRAEEAAQAGGRLSAARDEAAKGLETARSVRDEAAKAVGRLELEVHAAQAAEEQAWTALEGSRARVSATTADLHSREGEKAALDSLEVRLAGSDASRELLEKAREGRIDAQRVIADIISVEKDVERAAESFLGDVLPTVLVGTSDEVRKGAALGIRGKLRFLPLDSPEARAEGRELPEELSSDPRVRGRLATRVRIQDEKSSRLLSRLGDAILVDTLEAALELHRAYPDWNYLTPEGHVVYATGVVAIEGGAGGEEGLLARTRRRDELALAVEELRRALEEAERAVEEARSAHQDAQLVRRRVEDELAEARRSVATARMEVQQAERDLKRLEGEIDLARRARDSAASELDEARTKVEECVRLEDEASAGIGDRRRELEEARTRVRDHEDEVRAAVTALSDLSADARALRERRSGHLRDLERLVDEVAALDLKTEEGRRAREVARERAVELREAAARAETRCAELQQERRLAEEAVGSWASRLEEMTGRVGGLDARVAVVTDEYEGARARREGASLSAEKARLEWEHEQQNCRDELGCEPSEIPDGVPEGADPAVLESDAMLSEEILSLRRKRERVGPVNLLAEAEYAELTERFEELSGQRDDLKATVDELGDSIRKMNRESRDRFLEAFLSIRSHFREQFTTLFRGGRADLVLEDEENLLESGIEIMCQPPGKKLQSVSLLSGGEKALSATAVLFAIFRYQAPPFCLLDEVDAPLDDTNVHRFTEVVRGFSSSTQIILITHNKRSMETADVLYGVTMPEPGISRLVSMTLD